MGEQYYTSFI